MHTIPLVLHYSQRTTYTQEANLLLPLFKVTRDTADRTRLKRIMKFIFRGTAEFNYGQHV